ncbi:AAA family ATPase [Micromonospora sagamiensis]|uniref:Nuclease SbcCD subunit C n=1 Tax=Micromonospora sagamiensis TaxID=47875 RepID=A0A562WKS5_9ACTN|nr:AAA family ATPase [Micromonospora sagamiensis]TWJ30899.1 RecF/RecN/SMC family protein [Micromonospora sagamiensis]BCL16062.1 hypothetical protein GCM10017556_38010 [Micromonospora sagamiensis]
MSDPAVHDPDIVGQLVLDQLADAALPETAENLIVAALLGESYLADQLGGAAPPQRPRPTPTDPDDSGPVGTYLADIEVTGFRGIGTTATLNLTARPGLTIVTGRNGSGKSSFAEAAEFALTGDNKRWSERSTVWKKGWRNLHTEGGSCIRVRLNVDGHRKPATVECRWTAGADLGDHTDSLQFLGEQRTSVAELGWSRHLELYRPFLSYSELGGLINGKPSEMHDSLDGILGLKRVAEIEKLLKAARKDTDQRRRRAAEELPALRALLTEHPDPRARRAEEALAGRTADLDTLDEVATSGAPDDDATVVPLRQLAVLDLPNRDDLAARADRLRAALRHVGELAGTPAEQARALAGLLRAALAHHDNHPDQPCPVCGGRTLDEAWAVQARTQVRELTLRAEQLDAAHRAGHEARHALRQAVPSRPPVLTVDPGPDGIDLTELRKAWQRWHDLTADTDPAMLVELAPTTFDDLAAALAPVRAAAREALQRRRQDWQPVADRIRAWIDIERASRQAAIVLPDLRKAIEALKTIGATIRAERLRPIAAEATAIWNTLRQDSNVELDAIRLAGSGPARRVDLDVRVDGVPDAALSVMSQGELHSLALALFLPRATTAESPFRFLVIDDPVQSMDPAKVHGLAQVLHRVAATRQVVVFTHDDRLPAALRHLRLDARILTVSRRDHSQVTVDTGKDPAERYLKDAQGIADDEDMSEQTRITVACNLIRDALEYVCHERIRIAGLRAGTPFADIEDTIAEAQSDGLRPLLALALLGDHRRTDEVDVELRKVDSAAVRLVREVNRGAHGNAVPNLHTLVADGRRVAGRLSRP